MVLLTTFDDEDSILAALQAGARGYLTEEAGRDGIAAAIRAAAAGQSVLDPLVRAAAARTLPGPGMQETPATVPPDPPGGLTPRDAEVLALIAEGLSNREIARRLVVSEATVKTRINHLFAKLALHDRAHAVSYAFTHAPARTWTVTTRETTMVNAQSTKKGPVRRLRPGG